MLGFARMALMPIRFSPASFATHCLKKSSGTGEGVGQLQLVPGVHERSQSGANIVGPVAVLQAVLFVLPQHAGEIDPAADAVFGEELMVVVARKRPQAGDLQLAVRHSRVIMGVGQEVFPPVAAGIAQPADENRTFRSRTLRRA